ncbi:hypothetical protein KBF61_01415 [Candidatus Saccharibacteria bacterium]|jgi:hypothetical protein|nr:hypothetical protein [Candidatus Saccharibacteria bacterium]MBP9131770.1 hypothetical protein [Candidatus Saccharibacteria bacterium]
MNKIKYVIFATFIAASIVVVGNTGQEAQAAQTKICTLKPLTLDKYAKSFTVNGSKVTAKFTLSGDKDCRFDMSLFTFEATTANAMPVKDQTLYSHNTGTFGPGTHTLTASMPQCYHQLDLVTGKPLEAKKGDRANDVINLNNNVNQGRIGSAGKYNAHVHDALIGGNKSCTKSPVVVTPPPVVVEPETPVVEEPVTEEPVVEEPVVEEVPAEEPAEAPVNLPKTGASSAVLSIGAIGAAGKKLFRSRQGLKAALLSRK